VGPLIRRLIDAWEHAAPGWTPERKLHALETILEEGQSRWLPRRLERFIAGLRQPPGETSSSPAAAPEIDTAALTGALLELLAHTLHALELVGGDNDGIRAELGRLRHELLQPATDLTPQVVRLLQERLDALLDPLQCTLERKRAAEAELKRLLADFLSQLGQMSRETEQYQSQLQQAAVAIEQADDLASVAGELRTLLQATRHMSETTRQAREALERTRREAEDADAKVRALEAQLQALNEQLVRDPLTGLYNRNGLEAAFSRAIEALRQGGIPSLTLGVIDLDDFKRINDLFGHQAGDDSLKFLAKIARKHLREQDVIGRYGGENSSSSCRARAPRPLPRSCAGCSASSRARSSSKTIAIASSPSAPASPTSAPKTRGRAPSIAPTRRCTTPSAPARTASSSPTPEAHPAVYFPPDG